jgi:hypothetical protein
MSAQPRGFTLRFVQTQLPLATADNDVVYTVNLHPPLTKGKPTMKTTLLQGILFGLFLVGCGPVESAGGGGETDELAASEDALRKKNPCWMVKCWAGTHCEPIKGGGASCVPDLDPCATVRCGFGTTCVVVGGSATCQ